jgi:hypothetical protein
MMSRFWKLISVSLGLVGFSLFGAEETFHGSFAEPRDGGNLDVTLSTFDGTVAYLVPRWHESEALGHGPGARRWRNMLFAIRGVQGKIVTFHLPAVPTQTGAMVHNMDSATINLVEPVWSYQAEQRTWNAFTVVDCLKPDDADDLGAVFPADSVVDNSGKIVVKASSARREDYGWVFQNTTPFTEDVVYVSINEHYPVQEFYAWLENEVLSHTWVQPTASQTAPGSFMIGYQSGATVTTGAFSRTIEDTPLYAFKIQDPAARPTKVVMLVSGQHPYEGQVKAVLRGALEWILDPNDPAAAAYRAEYITLVYPFVNPTGELAGLWRGTALDPRRDVNRNWQTVHIDPLADRGIDTVIIHKQAMLRDVAALALGQPYAVVDLHQNFGDQLPSLHYVLHNTNPLATAWVQRLQKRVDVADLVSNPMTIQTLRSFWQFAGAGMTLCVERSTYSTLAAERAFGGEMMKAFLAEGVAPSVTAVSDIAPLIGMATRRPEVEHVIHDRFDVSGALHDRAPDDQTISGARWTVQSGAVTVGEGMALSSGGANLAWLEAGSIDAAVQTEVRLDTIDGVAGVVFRAIDRDNYYLFRIDADGWALERLASGQRTPMASGRASYSVGVSHTLRVEAAGNSVVLQANGAAVHTGVIVAEPGATRFGLWLESAYSVSAYDFEVRAGDSGSTGGEGGGAARDAQPHSCEAESSSDGGARPTRMHGPPGQRRSHRSFSFSALRPAAAE